MPKQDRSVAPVKAALAWAAQYMSFSKHEIFRQTPWTKVYLLSGHSHFAFLKLTRPELSHVLELMPVLAQQFPEQVPGVIALNGKLGAQLLSIPGGKPVEQPAAPNKFTLLATYANLQGRARHIAPLLESLPALNLSTLLERLLQFLDPAADHSPVANQRRSASRYLGNTRCGNYAAALASRVHLLAPLLDNAMVLPITINHGDLCTDNVTRNATNSYVLEHWDHALAGPAGISLHRIFDGCAIPATLLKTPYDSGAVSETSHARQLVDAYVQALEESLYATQSELAEGLPGAICAGAVQSMLRYAEYPDDSSAFRTTARRELETGLSDLLDLCDHLALNDRGTVLSCASDYAVNGHSRRAEKILRRYLSAYKNDTEAQIQLAHLLHKRGKNEQAIAAYGKAIHLQSDDAEVHAQLGEVLLAELRCTEAEESFAKAVTNGASKQRIEPRIEWSTRLRHTIDHARREDVVPAIQPSKAELTAAKWLPEQLALAAKLFHQHGVLLIHNAFDSALIDSCNTDFTRRYSQYFTAKTHADALRIGDRRYQISIALQGVFNDPRLYGNPLILALMKELLGAEFVLGCTVCATSLPGAKDQHWHKDHRALFARNENDPPLPLPPFAITTMVPLVGLDEKTGTTSVRKGSHLLSKRKSETLPEQLPMVPVGSCFLMDMRLSHRGLGNQSRKVRPIFNMVYQRYWFSDSRNFENHPPLRVPPAEYNSIPAEYRRLFAWGTQPGPQVNR